MSSTNTHQKATLAEEDLFLFCFVLLAEEDLNDTTCGH